MAVAAALGPPRGVKAAAITAVQPARRPLLLGLDLDGTVVDADNDIPAQTIEELQACARAGIRLAFLTGRRPRTAGFQLGKLGLPAYVATNSGCLREIPPGSRSASLFPSAGAAGGRPAAPYW
jgi:hypothetical protein